MQPGSGALSIRRYDIDWLRIAAVLLLIPFHSARVFNVGSDLRALTSAVPPPDLTFER